MKIKKNKSMSTNVIVDSYSYADNTVIGRCVKGYVILIRSETLTLSILKMSPLFP